MPTQSVIVYRNPVEAAFWEGGLALPTFTFILAAMLLIVGSMNALDAIFAKLKLPRFGSRYANVQYLVLGLDLVAAFFITAKVVG